MWIKIKVKLCWVRVVFKGRKTDFETRSLRVEKVNFFLSYPQGGFYSEFMGWIQSFAFVIQYFSTFFQQTFFSINLKKKVRKSKQANNEMKWVGVHGYLWLFSIAKRAEKSTENIWKICEIFLEFSRRMRHVSFYEK